MKRDRHLHARAPRVSGAHVAPGCAGLQVRGAIVSSRERWLHEVAATLAMTMILMIAALSAPVAQAQTLPQVRSQGAIEYVTGGVGKDEADALKQASGDYSLMLELASSGPTPEGRTTGAYVSDASIVIRDAQGREVLNTRTDGPLLLVRLPAGKYSITADWNGVRKQAAFDLGATRRHIVFDFARGAQQE